MKHGTRLWAALLALACAALPLAGCDTVSQTLRLNTPSYSEAVAEKTSSLVPRVSSTIEPGVLTVGIDVSTASAPLLIAGETNAVYGMDVDVASALADELGLEVKFVATDAVGNGLGTTCDIVMGASEGDVRDSVVVGSYAQSATAFFHHGDTGIARVEDLSSKRVGVQAGSVSETELQKTGLVMDIYSYENLNDAFEGLLAGEVDYVLCDAYRGAYIAAGMGDIAFVGTLDEALAVGVAIPTANTELAAATETALSTIGDNGVMGLIRQRWVGSMATITTDDQVQNIPEAAANSAEDEQSDSGEADGGPDAGANAATV